MGRILAVDFGTRRTGLAVTDPLQIIATGLQGVLTKDLFPYLKEYIATNEVEKVVVGWPTQDDGTDSDNAPNVQNFINKFKQEFPTMEVVLQDEWNTSNMAIQSMIAGGTKKKDRRNKLKVDVTSAVIILQSFMESKS